MNRYAYFLGTICTANADGSIPLNARMVMDLRNQPEGAIHDGALAGLIAQANLAADMGALIVALESQLLGHPSLVGQGFEVRIKELAERAREA